MHHQQAPRSVYVHIPFCKHKCYYCDFNTYAVQGQPVWDYLHALAAEMQQTVKRVPPGQIDTIFVGGGTPTILDNEQMRFLTDMLDQAFPERSPDLEFTMEANPGTTAPDKLQIMREGGVNRISFGVQSFQNELLEAIGRIHRVDEVYQSIEWARAAGLNNLSIDLMFGLPKQSLDHVEQSVDKALALELPHYSLYSLKVEEHTLFHTLYEQNRLPLPEEEEELAMYRLIMKKLESAGYRQYEISNFASPGKESRHNIGYWRNRSYYGLGAGAHGYVQGRRHVNVKGVQAYIEAAAGGLPVAEQWDVSREEAMEDFMMVGLRMNEGVSEADFAEQFGISLEEGFAPELAVCVEKGLLEKSDKGYRLTAVGRELGNEVFAAFVGVHA
ncbi:oxygen-independent coproporphyrinogen III oxidase [Xylanibacillus composti]|uniref:Heme chaperone HemW n=1 Tax=Xylanibacillus composti TaxID=1572762 RepID=A0A8J4H4W6_9BACL|nr:radical SAM family heme chaperone HemW [Xylanibacillus composti]MDT9724453.1 oxygen-independent coproporphyrinogen III oxidase [Xylanibacillus composti]GIQ69715.1 oxygen-independent coproporphyrinogen-III oxidase-like protein YqeR [Xylanibacillus composti]